MKIKTYKSDEEFEQSRSILTKGFPQACEVFDDITKTCSYYPSAECCSEGDNTHCERFRMINSEYYKRKEKEIIEEQRNYIKKE